MNFDKTVRHVRPCATRGALLPFSPMSVTLLARLRFLLHRRHALGIRALQPLKVDNFNVGILTPRKICSIFYRPP